MWTPGPRNSLQLGRCLALVAAVLLVGAPPVGARETERTIVVTGTATLTVPNDLARFTFGVTSRRRSASDALSATSVRLRSVIARLQSLGIAPGDLTTGPIDVTRTRRPLRSGSRVTVSEFVASGSIRATVRDVQRAGAVATAAVAAGATSVSGPIFSPGDPGQTARVALAAAFADAHDKAQRLADAAGVDLGGPITIQEGTRTQSGASTEDVLGNTEPGAKGRPSVPPPTRPGNSTVTATVTAVFAID